jgi:hypothetical protein
LKTFFGQTTIQQPQSIIESGEDVLSRTDHKNGIYRFVLNYLRHDGERVNGFSAVPEYFKPDKIYGLLIGALIAQITQPKIQLHLQIGEKAEQGPRSTDCDADRSPGARRDSFW